VPAAVGRPRQPNVLGTLSVKAGPDFAPGSVGGDASPPDSGGHTVIWFYAKQGRHLRCEVRQHVDGDRFDLIITDADGTERVEHFEDSASVTRRSLQLEAEWLIEGWDGPFGREY
jgi:hypothetical protein